MDLLEITEKHTLQREQAAELLHQLADSLARHNGLELMQDGKKLQVRVPAEVQVELEVEIESDGSSIEIELSW